MILYLFFFSLDKILLLTTMLTPLAINIREFEFGFGISIPTEPLMAGMLLMFLLKLIFNNDFDKKIWSHPVTIVVLLQLLWMFSNVTLFTVTFLGFVVPNDSSVTVNASRTTLAAN